MSVRFTIGDHILQSYIGGLVTHKFDLDTALERKNESTFIGVASRDWWVERGPNGGFLAALMLRALKAKVDDPLRPVRSLTVHYIAPPAQGSVEVTTAIERVGKSRISASARLGAERRDEVARARRLFVRLGFARVGRVRDARGSSTRPG